MKKVLLTLVIGLLLAVTTFAQEALNADQLKAKMMKEEQIIEYWKNALVTTQGVVQRKKIKSKINRHVITISEIFKKLDEIKAAEIDLRYERQYQRDLANQPIQEP